VSAYFLANYHASVGLHNDRKTAIIIIVRRNKNERCSRRGRSRARHRSPSAVRLGSPVHIGYCNYIYYDDNNIILRRISSVYVDPETWRLKRNTSLYYYTSRFHPSRNTQLFNNPPPVNFFFPYIISTDSYR